MERFHLNLVQQQGEGNESDLGWDRLGGRGNWEASWENPCRWGGDRKRMEVDGEGNEDSTLPARIPSRGPDNKFLQSWPLGELGWGRSRKLVSLGIYLDCRFVLFSLNLLQHLQIRRCQIKIQVCSFYWEHIRFANTKPRIPHGNNYVAV